MIGSTVFLWRETERLKDPVRAVSLVALLVGPFIVGMVVLRANLDQFYALDKLSQEIAIKSGAIDGWISILFAIYAVELPILAAFLTSESLAGEFVDGSALVWRSWPQHNAHALASKYLAAWISCVPSLVVSYLLFALVVVSWTPATNVAQALTNVRSLLFLSSYYTLLGLAISSWAPQPAASTVGTALVGYDWVILPQLLGPQMAKGLYFEYYWGILQQSMDHASSVALSDVYLASCVVAAGLAFLAALLLVGLHVRNPK